MPLGLVEELRERDRSIDRELVKRANDYSGMRRGRMIAEIWQSTIANLLTRSCLALVFVILRNGPCASKLANAATTPQLRALSLDIY